MLSDDLPEVYMITNDDFANAETLTNKVERQLKQGIKLVQLRIKKKKQDSYEFYANELSRLCDRYSAKLVLNHSLQSLPSIDCFGIHITSEELMAMQTIPDDIRRKYVISSPVHNDRELEKANQLKLDFAILTPIQKSISYPDVPYIGWQASEQFIKKANIPLYAAGGMQVEDLPRARDLGFVGIACLGALW